MTRREQIAPVIPLRPARRAVTWEYVAEQLTCSRSKAYELLQQCAAEAGLPRESGATLRVDESIWLAFYRRNFECGSTNETGVYDGDEPEFDEHGDIVSCLGCREEES